MDVVKKPNVPLRMDEDRAKKVRAIIDPLLLSDESVERVMATLQKEMKQGLSRDPAERKKTSLQMENTYVRKLLDGTENGDFLALDLGGTNFRVLLCKMRDGKCESVSRNYNVPEQKLHEPAKGVFDHLAESIHAFLTEENMLDQRLPLGFTFSFPMHQEGIKKGILVTWTKSFACPDGVGEDAVKALEEAIERKGGMKVDVVAVLNDTTGTLLAGSYLDHECYIGLIMGTGCNAAYVESLDNVDKWEGPKDEPKQVVIDTEWGAFGDNGSLDFLKTEFDNIIDQHSNHKGSFTYEKLFSGHYVGDLGRLVLLKLAQEGLIFSGKISKELETWKSFTASHISDMARDEVPLAQPSDPVVRALGMLDVVTEADRDIMHYLGAALTIRGAQIVSSCIAVLLNHMKKPVCSVAIDGSLYRYHPHMHEMMTTWIKKLAPDVQSSLILAEDGSGRGAAFVAAVAVRQQ